MMTFCFTLPGQINEIMHLTGWSDEDVGGIIGASPGEFTMLKNANGLRCVVGINAPYLVNAIRDLYFILYYNEKILKSDKRQYMNKDAYMRSFKIKGGSSTQTLKVRARRLSRRLGLSLVTHIGIDSRRPEIKSENGYIVNPFSFFREAPDVFKFATRIMGLSDRAALKLLSVEHMTTYHTGVSPLFDLCETIRNSCTDAFSLSDLSHKVKDDHKHNGDKMVRGAVRIMTQYQDKDWRAPLSKYIVDLVKI